MKKVMNSVPIVSTNTIVPKDNEDYKGSTELYSLGNTIINEVLTLPPPKNEDNPQEVDSERKYCPSCGGLCRETVIHELVHNELTLVKVVCSDCKYEEEMYE